MQAETQEPQEILGVAVVVALMVFIAALLAVQAVHRELAVAAARVMVVLLQGAKEAVAESE